MRSMSGMGWVGKLRELILSPCHLESWIDWDYFFG